MAPNKSLNNKRKGVSYYAKRISSQWHRTRHTTCSTVVMPQHFEADLTSEASGRIFKPRIFCH